MPRNRQQLSWPAVNFQAEPRLLVGRRAAGTRLEGYRFELHEDVFPALVEICRPLLTFLNSKPSRGYEPFTTVERDEEYLALAIDGLPKHPGRQNARLEADEPPTIEEDVADLVSIVRGVDGRDALDRQGIETERFTFSAICWPHGDSFVGFVTKANPVITVTTGTRYFRYEETLRRVERPNVVLSNRVDLFVGAETLAILNPSAFRMLLADVAIAMTRVPRDVAAVRRQLRSKRLPLSLQAAAALQEAAAFRLSFARRLNELPARIQELDITAERVRKRMTAHDLDPSMLLDQNEVFSFGAEDVEHFLDLMEGRFSSRTTSLAPTAERNASPPGGNSRSPVP